MASPETGPPPPGGEKIFAEGELVVLCAFCGRMRSGRSRWISLPLRLSQILQQETGRISHTYCPECLARHYPVTEQCG
jgi:hypothetical protein